VWGRKGCESVEEELTNEQCGYASAKRETNGETEKNKGKRTEKRK
jgi:hypothetical protein